MRCRGRNCGSDRVRDSGTIVGVDTRVVLGESRVAGRCTINFSDVNTRGVSNLGFARLTVMIVRYEKKGRGRGKYNSQCTVEVVVSGHDKLAAHFVELMPAHGSGIPSVVGVGADTEANHRV